MDPKKAAALWLRSTVFQDEAIRSRPAPEPGQKLPPLLQAARSLENGPYQSWQSRESVFMKQGKLLANYEDDFEYDMNATRYYPTYQSLSNQELRGYFTWRTRLRRGDVRKTSLSFAFLYVYELLNQIGVSDPLGGHRQLVEFRDTYGQVDGRVVPYLEQWRTGYVVYYELDPALLSDQTQTSQGQCAAVLNHIREQEDGEVLAALRQAAPWLGRSKFYAARQDDMDVVMLRVLRSMEAHCAKLKNTLADRYFGTYSEDFTNLFGSAVFCDPLNRKDYTYRLDEQCVYRCIRGSWYVYRRSPSAKTRRKLDNLLKTIDAAMREAFVFGHPIKTKAEPKWITSTIQEEIGRLLAEKQAAEEKKVSIDLTRLAQIRRDASLTQEKLIVEEELLLPEAAPAPPEQTGEASQPLPKAPPAPAAPPGGAEGIGEPPLTAAERRLLQCLLYGGGLSWVQAEGHMLSVLADGVNEKLYDTFMDTVLDDTPQVIEDYIDELKEMIDA